MDHGGTFADAARWVAVMEMRRLIAYALIVILAAFLTGVWRYATRERRAHFRTLRQAERRKHERVARESGI